jgi:hypothetical protein
MRKLILISAFVPASAGRETDGQKARQIAAQYGISW